MHTAAHGLRCTVTTLAGSGTAGFQGSSSAKSKNPCGVAAGGEGNVVVAGGSNHRTRKVAPGGNVITIAGSGTGGCRRWWRTWSGCCPPSAVRRDPGGWRRAHRGAPPHRRLPLRAARAAVRARVREFGQHGGERSAAAFRAFLRYLYADLLDVADEIVIEVLRLADRYQVTRLHNHCVRHCL